MTPCPPLTVNRIRSVGEVCVPTFSEFPGTFRREVGQNLGLSVKLGIRPTNCRGLLAAFFSRLADSYFDGKLISFLYARVKKSCPASSASFLFSASSRINL